LKPEICPIRFGNQLVLDQVSLNVRQGSIYGFLGPNGAGKTTTIKVLLNLLQTGEKKCFFLVKTFKITE
jgi:ABC-type multidrug transport system ATPase subunit